MLLVRWVRRIHWLVVHNPYAYLMAYIRAPACPPQADAWRYFHGSGEMLWFVLCLRSRGCHLFSGCWECLLGIFQHFQ
jgi:hypothetical protein